MKIKAVIFDMDGVITSSTFEHFEAWKVLAKKLKFSIKDEVEEHTKGLSRMDSLEVILTHCNLNGKYSKEEKIKIATDKNAIYQSMISQFTPNNLLPGVLTLLKELKSLNIKIALASASKNGPFLIERLEISEYFDYIVNPACLKAGKPSPEIFLKAAAELGISTKFCVGIEDAIAGVSSIKSAGMIAVGIGDEKILTQADIVYKDCSEIDLTKVDNLL